MTTAIRQVLKQSESDGSVRIDLVTDDGTISCRSFPASYGDSAVLWVFGAGGGWGGPARGVYARLGRQLAAEGTTSLEVAYRYPAQLRPCVLDVLAGVEWLASEDRKRIVLVGHSFGGAVVIQSAGSKCVIAVAAMSSQLHGARNIGELRGKPVLLVHGQADEVLPDLCSRTLYDLACEPKKLILYPGCRHGLDECQDALDRDLLTWLRDAVSPGHGLPSTGERSRFGGTPNERTGRR